MPYFITADAKSCSKGWAVVKADGEIVGCHADKSRAIKHMVAMSLEEDIEPGGTYEGENEPFEAKTARNVENQAEITKIEAAGSLLSAEYDSLDIEGPNEGSSALQGAGSLQEESSSEQRKVNLEPPAYMRAAARRGLSYYEQGLGGSGLKPQTIREAKAMARGSVTAEKWVRLRAWIARHMGDLDSPAANPNNDGYPSAGVVAHLLWGSGPSKRAAQRALDYAEKVVGRLESENTDRGGKPLPALEQRTNPFDDYELIQDAEGMSFEGYAALFDSPSKPLPFIERIAPGAFIRSLKARNDIKLLWNHDSGQVLGSTRAGTLKLIEDERGLKVQAKLPNTTAGRDAAELLKRGDVDAMSFGFNVPRGGDEWNEDGTERTLREVMLHEVSIVAFPAYAATAGTTSVRGLAKVAERAGVDLDALSDTLIKLEEGEDMTAEEAKMLEQVLDSIAPEKPAEESPEDAEADKARELLELKKLRLKLLELENG